METPKHIQERYGKYPNIYAKENGSGINTESVKTDGIGISEDGYTSPTKETSSKADNLTVTQSYYYLSSPSSYFDNSEAYDVIFGTYWLASRCVNCDLSYALFGLMSVGNSYLNGNNVYVSRGATYRYDYCVRPVVSLGPDMEITACEGENSSSNMHQISKK